MSADLTSLNDRRFPQFASQIGSPIARCAARTSRVIDPAQIDRRHAVVIKTRKEKLMRWIITGDLICTNSHGVGDDDNGRRIQTCVTEGDSLLTDFRLYDDNGKLYYEGRTNDIHEDEERAFAPLDWAASWGTGCTTLKYRQHGLYNAPWEEL